MGWAVIYKPDGVVANQVLQYLDRIDEPLYQGQPNTLVNCDLSQVESEPDWLKWKVSNGRPVLMTQQEKDSILAAELASALAANRIEAKSNLDGTHGISLLEKAIIDGVVSQVANPLRQWLVQFKAQVASASSLADLKLRVATLPDMPDITFSQVKTYLKNKIDSGDLDNI